MPASGSPEPSGAIAPPSAVWEAVDVARHDDRQTRKTIMAAAVDGHRLSRALLVSRALWMSGRGCMRSPFRHQNRNAARRSQI